MVSDSQTSFCGPGGDTFSCHTLGHLDKGSALRLNVSVSWVQQVYPAGGVTYSGATSVFEQNGNTNGAELKKERKSVWKVYRVETRPNAMTGEETEQSVLGRDLPRPRHSSAGGPWVHAHRREASCLCWEMSTHRLLQAQVRRRWAGRGWKTLQSDLGEARQEHSQDWRAPFSQDLH